MGAVHDHLMTAIAIRNFRGSAPRVSDRSLGPSQSVRARNCRLTSGRLDPIKGLLLSHTSTLPSIRTAYRYRFENDDNWLVWDRRVHVAASPIAEDAFGRLYFTGDGEPRMTTYAAAISGGGAYPGASFVLGVYAPLAVPTVTPVGGSGTDEERSYVYTFRTPLGEESGPSPASALATGKPDATWTVSGMEAAPPNSGTVTGAARNTPSVGMVRVSLDTSVGLTVGEELAFANVLGMTDLNARFAIQAIGSGTVDILLTTTQTYASGGTWDRAAPHNLTGMTKRVYRTIAGEFRFVAEVDVAVTSYADTRPSADVAQEDPLQALTLPPPKNLRNLVVLANGAMCGIAGNMLCFSEINRPHSWPIGNRSAFAGEGVALTPVGNSVILLTDSFPIVATATVPEAVSLSRLDQYAPCYSEEGTVDAGQGAIYPSYDGLYLATPAGAKNLTEGLYRLQEWESLIPRTFVAAFHDQTYHAVHTSLVAPQSQMFSLDLTMPDGVIEHDQTAEALYANPIDGRLYLSKEGSLYVWDADPANPFTAYWRSREYQTGADTNFAFYRVHAIFPRISNADVLQLAANIALMADADNVDGAVGAAGINVFAINGSAIVPAVVPAPLRCFFTLLRNGESAFTQEVRGNKERRLPAGFLDNVYAVELSTTTSVYSVAVANDVDELALDNA